MLAILTSAGVVSGCAGPAETDSDPQSLGTVTVLAAASLTETFTTLARRLEAEHPGADVQLSFAASSELASQVTAGAPADVFASASTSTMATVVAAGSAKGEPVVFARNRLEIAVPRGNPGDVNGLADLAREELSIALCAPEVPCGAAAVAAFAAAGIQPRPDTLEPDVKATLAKVLLGEVDAALVYRTDVRAAGSEVVGVDLPGADDTASDYPITVLAGAPNAKGARAFVDLVRSPSGRGVLADAGFDLP